MVCVVMLSVLLWLFVGVGVFGDVLCVFCVWVLVVDIVCVSVGCEGVV